MKIGVKPLKGEPFEVEVSPDELVESLKQKINASRPELAVELQKLVCSGKILENGKSLQDLGVQEGNFVVVMMAKPKDPAPAAAEAAPATAPADAAMLAPPAVDPVAAAQAAAQAAQFEANITNLCEMGFPRSMVEACLKAAFNNPDRAVEYLMNGIPAGAQAPLAGPPAGPPAPAPPVVPAAPAVPHFPSVPVAPGADAAAATGPLASLRRHPRYNEFRQVVQHRPEVLNQVLAHWMRAEPNLMQLVAENQEEFVKMLQEPVGPPATGQQDPIAAMIAAAQGGAMPPGGAAQAPQPQIQLTDADREAVERLMSLGFPRERAIEAYLACDRKEDVAASFLFDAMEA